MGKQTCSYFPVKKKMYRIILQTPQYLKGEDYFPQEVKCLLSVSICDVFGVNDISYENMKVKIIVGFILTDLLVAKAEFCIKVTVFISQINPFLAEHLQRDTDIVHLLKTTDGRHSQLTRQGPVLG